MHSLGVCVRKKVLERLYPVRVALFSMSCSQSLDLTFTYAKHIR